MKSYSEVVMILRFKRKVFYFSGKNANAESTMPNRSQLAFLFRLFDSDESILLK